MSSIMLIKEGLYDFHALTGLTASPTKSQTFLSGVGGITKADITTFLGFSAGFLPVRYLGIPLTSTRSTRYFKSICMDPVNKLLSRINHWTGKTLSYAGQAQLIKSILFSLQVYRSSIFIQPKDI